MGEPLGLEGRASVAMTLATALLGGILGGAIGFYAISETPQSTVSEYLKPLLFALLGAGLFGAGAVLVQSNRPAYDEPFIPSRRRRR